MSDGGTGRIVQLQIQQASLKVGPTRARRYDPSPILMVDRLILTPDGAEAVVDGARLIDVHHGHHPDSKNRNGVNDLSIGFTGNYRRIRERLGAHIVDGIAGESILVACDDPPALGALMNGIEIEVDPGLWIRLAEASVAHPCVEFSRFCLRSSVVEPRQIKETLQFLDDGTRGFYVGLPAGDPIGIAVGAAVRWRG